MIGDAMLAKIKELEAKGMSQREISEVLNYSRNTIAKYINGEPAGYHRKAPIESPVASTIMPIIESWIKDDESVPRKQRRTASKIYHDLKASYGYSGGYSTVSRLVRNIKGIHREVFIPRHHEPGMMGEFDFGEFYVDVAGERIKVYLHAFQLTCSNDIFGYISWRASQEEMFYSHELSFENWEGIPQHMRYDNLSLAVKKVLKGREREESDAFRTFKDRLGFESEFCEVAKGWQKGDVEGCVGYIRRNFLSPVPQLKNKEDLLRLNVELATWCRSLRESRITYGTDRTVGEIYAIEKPALFLLPYQTQPVGKHLVAKANHYSLVPVDTAFYSVPVRHAHQPLDVLLTAREVIVYAKEKEIARHCRVFVKGQQVFDAVHYIELFRRKPYSLINSKPIHQLPPCFQQFFEKAYHKGRGTVSDCIDILELLKDYSLKDLTVAIELAMSYETYHSDGVRNLVQQLTKSQPIFEKVATFKNPALNEVSIPAVDLKRYNVLIEEGAS